MALARDNAPSAHWLVDAPVKTLILNGRPASCSFTAFAAIASGTTLGDPDAVNPENPQVSSFFTKAAASAAVRIGNAILLQI